MPLTRPSPRRRPLRASLLLVLSALLSVTSAHATVVAPVSDDHLARQAVAIVIGHVKAIESHWDPAQNQIFTQITITLDEVLKGNVPLTDLTIKQVGGTVNGLHSWVEGSPEFTVGEKVLLFLRRNPDGTLRVAHLYQGKLSVFTDSATGDEWTYRHAGEGVRVLGRLGAGGAATSPPDVRHFRDLKRRLRTLLQASGRTAPEPVAVTAPLLPAGAVTETHGQFTFLSTPARWFEADSGQPVRMLMNSAGEPLAPGSGFPAVRAAYNAWSTVAGSSFQYLDAGFTSAVGFRSDGVNAISFRDPLGQIDPPGGCGGTLAIGGYFRSGESRVINGQSFARILEGDVVVADGWNGCGFYESSANFAEVMTHELGHVLGLGHSSDPTATMYARAHFDGRGASLRADDMAGLRFIYPGSGPGTVPTAFTVTVAKAGSGSGTVTSSPGGINCGPDCTETYSSPGPVTLTPTVVAGSIFGGWSGGCSGSGACAVSTSTSVTATFLPATLTLAFVNPPSGGPVSGPTTVTLSAGGGGTGYVYKLAVDNVTVYTGASPSFSWNTTTVANGGHTLTATVTDSLGRTGSATRTVTVSNGSTPAAGLKVSYLSPAPGATIKGTVQLRIAVEGASGSKTFTVVLDGRTAGSWTTSGNVMTLRWYTTSSSNGPHTIATTVRDATGKTGSATLSVTVQN